MTPAEDGCATSRAVFFQVRDPTGPEIPVVVEVPHAGLTVDAVALATLRAPASSLARDADLYVDELYVDAPSLGATLLSATISRYICDLNRAEHEVDGEAVDGAMNGSAPHGVVWRSTTEGQAALHRPLRRQEYDRRIRTIYRPYHAALQQLLEQKVQRFGFAILLCGHSMPSRGRMDAFGRAPVRADVVPGSRGRSTAADVVIRAPELVARARGWTVAHDDPYRGGFATATYGQPQKRVHAVQVELARRLYMDEHSLERKPAEFLETRDYCRSLVATLGDLALA